MLDQEFGGEEKNFSAFRSGDIAPWFCGLDFRGGFLKLAQNLFAIGRVDIVKSPASPGGLSFTVKIVFKYFGNGPPLRTNRNSPARGAFADHQKVAGNMAAVN